MALYREKLEEIDARNQALSSANAALMAENERLRRMISALDKKALPLRPDDKDPSPLTPALSESPPPPPPTDRFGQAAPVPGNLLLLKHRR